MQPSIHSAYFHLVVHSDGEVHHRHYVYSILPCWHVLLGTSKVLLQHIEASVLCSNPFDQLAQCFWVVQYCTDVCCSAI